MSSDYVQKLLDAEHSTSFLMSSDDIQKLLDADHSKIIFFYKTDHHHLYLDFSFQEKYTLRSAIAFKIKPILSRAKSS